MAFPSLTLCLSLLAGCVGTYSPKVRPKRNLLWELLPLRKDYYLFKLYASILHNILPPDTSSYISYQQISIHVYRT
ncbi:hypothetical protein VNO77_13553 [Canavalia gladiata]|uniref:Uncharacterized protein n=1 Tax=Canavalia gladiata TaxID=3824 RepID=A0AAN9LXY1_CANGL